MVQNRTKLRVYQPYSFVSASSVEGIILLSVVVVIPPHGLRLSVYLLSYTYRIKLDHSCFIS